VLVEAKRLPQSTIPRHLGSLKYQNLQFCTLIRFHGPQRKFENHEKIYFLRYRESTLTAP
jgi:hypothetical protein